MSTPRSKPSRRLPRARIALAGALVLALAACGSNLDPDQVAGTSSGGNVVAADGTVTDSEGNVVAPDGTVTDGDGNVVTPGDTSGGLPAGTPGDTGGGDTPDGAPSDPDANEPPVDVPSEADCEGFKNQVGITDDKIVIGNASDISGPAPGLFATAQDATSAFVAYFNASVPDGICGRKLELKTYDSRTDAGADQQAAASACKEVFAMVGSQSAFDLGGAKTTQDCGLPDIRAGAVTFERNACTTCFAAQAVNTKFFQNAVPDFIKKTYGEEASKKAAYFYSNAGAAAQNALAQVKAMERRGMEFPVVQGIEVAEFNYAPFVQQLKDKDIEIVFFTTEYSFSLKMRQAMQQQGYEPKAYLRDPTDYNPKYVDQGGDAVDGTTVFINYAPYEEANKESDLYEAWLGQVKPGTAPLFFGTFAWSASRLFVELAAKLGGKLSRETLISELKGVKDWTANDLHAPQPVGSKGTGECWRFIQLSGGAWKPVGGTKYTCTGLTGAS